MSGYSKSRGELRYYQLECQETGRELGRGSYATVVELTHKGLRCAGKKIYRVLFSQNNLEGHVERFTHECRLISELRHPNIVQFLGVYFEPQQEVPVLVLEYLPLTLAQCLDQYGTPPPEIGYLVLSDVALGLRFLHERSPPIIHRDLSANNVLLAEDFSAKISDLGVAKMVNIPAACVSTMTRVPGTPCYMPPEALVPDPKYDSTIDVFSYGILILHTFSGKWPIPSEPSRVDPAHPHQLVAVSEADRRLAYIEAMGSGSNSGCGQAARGGREATHPLTTLARACLHNNPGQRPSSKEIWEKVSEVSGRHKLSYRDKLQLLLKMVDGGAREGQGQVGGGGVAAATAAAAAGGAGLTAGRDVSPWSTKPSSREKVNVSSREGVNANTGREGVNANTGREGVNANTGREGVNANTGREGVNATSGREGITATSGREGGGVTTAAVVNEKKKKTPPKKAEKPPSGGGGGGRGGGGGAERSLKDIWEERMQPKSPEKSQRADELFPKPSQQKEARARALEGLTGNRGVREGLTGGGREGLTGGGGGGGGEGLMGKAGKKRNVADNWLANLSKDTPTTSKSQAPQRKTSQGSDNKPHPPAAQEVEKKTFAVVMYDFEARAEHKDELTVYAGEEVEILGGEECMEDPWVMVREGGKERGREGGRGGGREGGREGGEGGKEREGEEGRRGRERRGRERKRRSEGGERERKREGLPPLFLIHRSKRGTRPALSQAATSTSNKTSLQSQKPSPPHKTRPQATSPQRPQPWPGLRQQGQCN